jgi:hypothetical protein
VKRPKDPPKYPLGVWVEIDAGTPMAFWLRTVENMSGGRVMCQTRTGAAIIMPRSLMPEPQKRKRPLR